MFFRKQHPSINYFGFFRQNLGIGQHARLLAQCLHQAHFPVTFVQALPAMPHEGTPEDWPHPLLPPRPEAPINILHFNPEQWPHVRASFPGFDFSRARNIGYWAWELPDFPQSWRPFLSDFQEVWVPSRFTQAAIRQQFSGPVHVVPPPLPRLSAIPERLFPNRFTFFVTFDFRSERARKNPDGAVEVYRRLLDQGLPVALVLKCQNSDYRRDENQPFLDSVRALPHTRIITESVPRQRFLNLLAGCDCLLSLHRAEGFGLVLAEAMALRVLVAATAWSGNLDFMDPRNALPIPSRLLQLTHSIGPYPAASSWAEPDIGAATSLLHAALVSPKFRRRLTHRARHFTRKSLSLKSVSLSARDLLVPKHNSKFSK